MASSPTLRPRCRPDGQQVFPTVVGATTLASLVLTSSVLGAPAEAGRDSGARILGPVTSVSQDHEAGHVPADGRSPAAWVSQQDPDALAAADLRTAT